MPAAGDAPTVIAAASLVSPLQTSRQNARSTSRRSDGLPGDCIGDLPVNSFIRPAGLSIDTSTIKVLRRPFESAEYNSESFGQLCGRWGVSQYMGRVGSALDNAAAQSLHSGFKVEYVYRHRFATRVEARIRIATWITDFYNTRRRHSTADGQPPVTLEHTIREVRGHTGHQDQAA